MENNNENNNDNNTGAPPPPVLRCNESGASGASHMSLGVNSLFANPMEKAMRASATTAGKRVAFGTVLSIPTSIPTEQPWDPESDFFKEHAILSWEDHKAYIKKSGTYINDSEKIKTSFKNNRGKIVKESQTINKEKQGFLRQAKACHDKLKELATKYKENEEAIVKARAETNSIREKTGISRAVVNKSVKWLAKATCRQARVYAGLDTPADWEEQEHVISKKLSLLVKVAFCESEHCPIKTKWACWSVDGEKSVAFKARAKKYVGYVDPPPLLALQGEPATVVATTVVANDDLRQAPAPTVSTPTAAPADFDNKAAMAAHFAARAFDQDISPRERKNAKRMLDLLVSCHDEEEEEDEDLNAPTPKRRKVDAKDTNASQAEGTNLDGPIHHNDQDNGNGLETDPMLQVD